MNEEVSNQYYKKEIYLLQVDTENNPVGQIERWKAHKEGILHRGFTAILKYKDNFVLQHRKHIVFDNYFDLSFSSHPVFDPEGKLQTYEEAILNTLNREWEYYIDNNTEIKIKFLSKYYYKEQDIKSGYVEHEINYLYFIELTNDNIKNNPEYSYGMKFISKEDLINNFENLNLCPWVLKIDKNILMNL